MDYLKIVLDGYINPSTNEHLTDYFFREFKKVEKEYFSPKEFFESGCLGIIDIFKADIKDRLYKDKNMLYDMIGHAKDGTIKYQDLTLDQMKNPKLVQEQKEKCLVKWNDRLLELSENSYYAQINRITKNRYTGLLSWERIQYIEYSILAAFEKVLLENQKENIPIMVKINAPVLGFFCGLIDKISIDKRDETENATVYCERICKKFKLNYTDRVRQNFNVNETTKLKKALTEKIFPLIDNETKSLIQKYLDSKLPPKNNLYG